MRAPSEIANPELFSIRLLLPFHIEEPLQFDASIRSLKWRTSEVWGRVELPSEYESEMRSEAAQFLCPPHNDAEAKFSYSRVAPQVLNAWFGRTIDVGFNGGEATMSIDYRTGIELWTPGNRIGILSFSLVTAPDEPCSIELCTALNYYLSHVRWRVPSIGLPAGRAVAPSVKAEGEPAPAHGGGDLANRLGVRGQRFSLPELADYLLSPVAGQITRPEENEFVVHSVLAFPSTVDFRDAATRTALVPSLAGFAQLEEVKHSPAPADTVGVPIDIISANHAASCSSLACAHFVSFQTEPSERAGHFDAQRVQIVHTKYAVGFIISLAQRLAVQRFLQRGAVLGRSASSYQKRVLPALWSDFYSFEAQGLLLDVSRRPAVNRCFRMAHAAQQIPQTISRLHDLLRDIESHSLVQRQVDLQSRVGRIEVFIVFFYTTELCHVIGELLHFDPFYLLSGMFVFGSLAAIITNEIHHAEPTLRLKIGLLAVLVALGAWAGVGYQRFGANHTVSGDSQPHETLLTPLPPVESPPANSTAIVPLPPVPPRAR